MFAGEARAYLRAGGGINNWGSLLEREVSSLRRYETVEEFRLITQTYQYIVQAKSCNIISAY